MARLPFQIGDEVSVKGVVLLIDAAGPGTVTIELHVTSQRITLRAGTTLELVAKGPRGRLFDP